jgi:glycosyltransferase involved in cell wall biosynthesis
MIRNQDLNILFITSHCPNAPTYGTQLRIRNIAKLLGRVARVSFAIAPYFPIDEKYIEKTRQEFDLRRFTNLNRTNRLGIGEMIRRELDPSFLNTDGIEICEDAREDMLRLMDEYDVIWVHTLKTANAFGIFQWPHTVIDIDDIPSKFFASAAKPETNIVERMVYYRRSFLWWRRERLLKKRFSVIAVCSEDDRKYLGGGGQIHVIPNGFAPPTEAPTHFSAFPARLGFIGTFEYPPNRIGIEWFVKDVWPKITQETPETKLRLIGKRSEEFTRMGPNIDGLGYVEDPAGEIATWAAMIVPVTIGGGTRVKIPEAFSRKCPIVSTSLGAFGYEVISGEDLLLADTPQDFASACVLLLKNKEVGLKISENAWKKYLKRWTWDSIGPSVYNAVNDCISRSPRD